MNTISIPLRWLVATAAVLLFAECSAYAAEGVAEGPDAVPTLGEGSSIQDYLRYAALRNTGLEAAFNRWKAAVERVPQARSLPDPRFNYTYFVEEVETRVGPQRQKFGVMQAFPWFGKLRLREDAALQQAAAIRQEYERTKLALFYRVKKSYHDYWYLSQAIAVTKEHLLLVKNLEGVARARFKAGATEHNSVNQAQVELGKLDDRLRSLESLRQPIAARLNAALNRPSKAALPWPTSLPPANAEFSDDDARQWLIENSPDLRRLGHLVMKEDANVQLAKKNYFPDVTLGIDYIDTDDAIDPTMTDSGKDPVMAMVSVNLPLWYGKYRAAEQEATYRRTAAAKEKDDAENRLESDLSLALYHLRDAERKVDLYGNTLVPKARQSLKVAQQGFEAGNTSFIALIDAQRLLLEFQLAHHKALADRGVRVSEIEMLTGKETEGE
jgi:outer membrane protein TolC